MVRFMKRSDFSGWPPGISSGLVSRCHSCQRRPAFDYQVDDKTWKRVVPRWWRLGVICLPCLDAMAADHKIDVCQHLVEVQFAGQYSTVLLMPTLVIQLASQESLV